MGPDLRIDWNQICANPADFEKLVKLLLQRLHGSGQAIDGSGGDGGREFEVRTPDSLTLYEAKSFTGRLTPRSPRRRPQVELSLVSAARHQPDAWNLIVPIDPNPDELKWFDALRAGDFPFVDRWLGQSWLESELVRHEDLIRHVMKNKLLEYVRLYKIETEAVTGGVVDLLSRYEALDRLSDELSPDYRAVIGRHTDGARTVELRPKHPDATDDAPITFQFTATVPSRSDTVELLAQMRASHAFGTGVEIPGDYLSGYTVTGPSELGLPGSNVVLDSVKIGELADTEDLPEQSLAVYEPGAAIPTASLRFYPETRTRGAVGVRLVAYDLPRTIRLITEVRFDGFVTFRLQAQPARPILPSAVLPGWRLAQGLRSPNELMFTFRHGDETSRHVAPLRELQTWGAPSQEMISFVENLVVIQDTLRQPFPLPQTVTLGDVKRAARLRRLLEGEIVPWVHGSVTTTIDPDKISEFKAQWPSEGRVLRVSWEDQEVRIGAEVMHTGPMFMTGTVTTDADAIPDHPEPGEDVNAVFSLVDERWFDAQRGTPSDEQAEPGVDGGAAEAPGRGHGA